MCGRRCRFDSKHSFPCLRHSVQWQPRPQPRLQSPWSDHLDIQGERLLRLWWMVTMDMIKIDDDTIIQEVMVNFQWIVGCPLELLIMNAINYSYIKSVKIFMDIENDKWQWSPLQNWSTLHRHNQNNSLKSIFYVTILFCQLERRF